MKKIYYFAAAMLLVGTMAACSESPKIESSSRSSAAGSSSVASSEVASQVSSGALTSSGGENYQVMKMQVFVQQDSGAEEGYEPTIRLLENGNFEFAAYHYDGVVLIHGTYTVEEDSYRLTPTENTSQGAVGADVGEITLAKTESGVVFSGTQVGVTNDGAEFEKQ